MTERESPARLILIGVGGALLCAVAATISLANTESGGGALWAAIGAVTIAAPVGVGLYAWRQDPGNRFGPLLVAAGYGWTLTTLAHSNVAVLYSIGRVSSWVFLAVVIYVLLAFPSGRLERRRDALLAAAAALVVLVMYVPTAFLVTQYPTPAPFAACGSDCPSNALQLTGSEPGFVGTVEALRELLAIAVFFGVAWSLAARLIRATRLRRRTVGPVLAAVVSYAVLALAYIAARRAGAGTDVLDPLGVAFVLTFPAVSVGVLIGLLNWRLYCGSVLERLMVGLREAHDPDHLLALIADAVDDPSLELYFASPGRQVVWRDGDGQPAELPHGSPERHLSQVLDGDAPVAALVCDRAVGEDSGFIEAVGSCARAALETQRLTTALRSSLRDIEESRSRLAIAAASERRRIERDLHDSTQQQLVTLRVKLELAGEQLNDDPSAGATLLAELGPEIDEIIDGIRSLSHEIYPSVLADSGLADALRSAALHSSLPISVAIDGLGRYPIEVESAVYFCCLEALQNAAKHAAGATQVSIAVSEHDRELTFEVDDDGRGFIAENGGGAGLTNMRDRVAAVGGRLSISSTPGSGTTVAGVVPMS